MAFHEFDKKRIHERAEVRRLWQEGRHKPILVHRAMRALGHDVPYQQVYGDLLTLTWQERLDPPLVSRKWRKHV